MGRASWAFLTLALLVLGSTARAVEGGEHWSSTFALPGADGAALTSVEFQGDLIIGGEFTDIGMVTARHVARWDGEAWSPMGDGLDGPVRALAMLDDELYAAGDFDHSGPAVVQGVARWDGEHWQSLGEPLDWYSVNALVVYDGQLVAGGIAAGEGVYGEWFEVAGIVTWDGEHWQELADFEWDHNSRILTMAVDSYGLAVAGCYAAINGDPDLAWAARWDGLAWSGMDHFASLREFRVVAGQLLGSTGYSIYAWNGADWLPIIDAQGASIGSFAFIDGRFVAGMSGGWPAVAWVAEWDGAEWVQIGGVFSNITTFTTGASMSLVTSYEGQLIASGRWVHTEGVGIPSLATWNGSQWVECMSLDEQHRFKGLDYAAYSLGVWEDQPVVAGPFELSWHTPLDGLALWADTTWDSLGPGDTGVGGSIYRFTDYQGELVASGSFSSIGGVPAENLAGWDGSHWRELAGGEAHSGRALRVEGPDLYIGGYYAPVYGQPGGYVARWDGQTWVDLSVRLNSSVNAIEFYDGQLVAAGIFTADAQGRALGYIARWDGSSWQPLGAGLDYRVNTLVAWGGQLFAGGEFWHAGGQSARYLAAWDGLDWHALPDEFDGPVGQACVYRGDLLVAGQFDTVGGQTVNGIARWNGSAWTPLGEGLTQPSEYARLIFDLRVIGDDLYVAGAFQGAGGKASYGIACWTEAATAVQDEPPTLTLSAWNHPNPFNPSTEIVFTLPAASLVSLHVYDAAGRHVRTLLDRAGCLAGETRATWDGRDDSGRPLPSGVYLYSVEAGGRDAAHKAVLLK